MHGSQLVRIGLTVLAALVWAAAGTAETMDELYAKAKPEQRLVLYGGGPVEPFERWAKEFEQKFPGLSVSVTGGYSNILDQKIDQQIRDKRLEVDMAIFQTVQDFVAWKKAGVLLPFKPDGFEQIHESFRDPDGAFTTVSANPLPYAYNTKLVRQEDVPRSALDFLKPSFAGHAVTAYPADDDATLYVFDTIVRKYGWGFMDKYMATRPTFIQGHLGVLRRVASGDSLATFDATVTTAGGLKRAGEPIEIVFSDVDPVPVFTITAGIFKDAPHPNAAKLYLDWYMAKEQQSRTGTFSARTDVPPPAGLKPLSSYTLENNYRAFVTDDAQLTTLRKRFEAYTGPVENKGGVR
jgi:ABC-type Fe3+ transport system substrate-binding protein